jgi:hypothetical protein
MGRAFQFSRPSLSRISRTRSPCTRTPVTSSRPRKRGRGRTWMPALSTSAKVSPGNPGRSPRRAWSISTPREGNRLRRSPPGTERVSPVVWCTKPATSGVKAAGSTKSRRRRRAVTARAPRPRETIRIFFRVGVMRPPGGPKRRLFVGCFRGLALKKREVKPPGAGPATPRKGPCPPPRTSEGAMVFAQDHDSSATATTGTRLIVHARPAGADALDSLVVPEKSYPVAMMPKKSICSQSPPRPRPRRARAPRPRPGGEGSPAEQARPRSGLERRHPGHHRPPARV